MIGEIRLLLSYLYAALCRQVAWSENKSTVGGGFEPAARGGWLCRGSDHLGSYENVASSLSTKDESARIFRDESMSAMRLARWNHQWTVAIDDELRKSSHTHLSTSAPLLRLPEPGRPDQPGPLSFPAMSASRQRSSVKNSALIKKVDYCMVL